MLQTVNVSDQTLHGRSVTGRVFGCQIYIKCNFSERFFATFTLAMIVVNFFIQNGLRQEELIQKTKA